MPGSTRTGARSSRPSWRRAGGRITRLAFAQRDPDARRGLVWTQQLDVVLGYRDHVEHVPAKLSGASVDVAQARGRPAPLFVLANGGGIAYGEIHLDAASRAWLSANVFRIAIRSRAAPPG